MWARLPIFFLFGLSACGSGSAGPTSRTTATDPSPSPQPEVAEDPGEDVAAEDAAPEPRISLSSLGVTVALPENATVDERETWRFDIDVDGTLVRIQRVDVAPPTTLEGAVARTSTRRPHRIWDQGTSPSGVFYVATTFQTREGFSDGRRQIHHLLDITRVYGTLPVDGASFVECTVYIDAGRRDDPEPPDFVRTGVDICASMRRANATTAAIDAM